MSRFLHIPAIWTIIALLCAGAILLQFSANAQTDQNTKTERLLKTELDPFAFDENGWTHLHWAAVADDGKAIRKLIIEMEAFPDPVSDSGDDFTNPSKFSDTGKRRAQVLGVKIFHNNRAETPLHIAALFSKIVAASVLIDSGADVKAKDKHGDTPLHHAASRNAAEVAKLLIDNGADVNAKIEGGNTPLHGAAGKEVAKLLIDNGADVNAKNNGGTTPLHGAALTEQREVAALLLENGADVNAKTTPFGGWPGGKTPMDLAIIANNAAKAVGKENPEMQEFLRSHGGRCNREC